MDPLRLILLIVGVLLIAGIYVWELMKRRAAARPRPEAEATPRGVVPSVEDLNVDDPLEAMERIQDERAASNAGDLVQRSDFDIDEDFPELGDDESTWSPAKPDVGQAPPGASGGSVEIPAEGDSALAALSGLTARRDSPEQLDLSGLEMSAGALQGSGNDSSGSRGPAGGGGAEGLVIALTVMAREGDRFPGNRLRGALEEAGLRWGDMQIFHRFADHPRAPRLFSVANVLAPGTFDLANMGGMSSSGLAFFLQLPGPADPVEAFQQMLDTARGLAEELDGVVCDETRSTLTSQSINHLRERIADFGRRQMLKA
jgi:cell division protein ZipA